MPKSVIVEGKTTAEATEKGLKELGVTKDMVEIKVLEEGDKRSFYNILTPRVVKLELTLKEGVKKEKEEKPAKREEVKKEYVESSPRKEKRPTNQDEEEIKNGAENVEEFLSKFLTEEITYEVSIKEYDIHINIQGENVNYLIGYRGETINSLQTIISAIANKKATAKIKVYVDIAGYRDKRVKTLEDLADKIAKTVIRTGKSITLEPMSAYERKVIHTRLQEQAKVKTFSKGEEPYRKIVVELK